MTGLPPRDVVCRLFTPTIYPDGDTKAIFERLPADLLIPTKDNRKNWHNVTGSNGHRRP